MSPRSFCLLLALVLSLAASWPREVCAIPRRDGATPIASAWAPAAVAFSDIAAGLPGLAYGAVAWGDYDNDGDLDCVMTGDTGSGYLSSIDRNDGDGTFTDIAAGLPGVWASAVAWGDYDNDGDLDLVLAGQASTGRVTGIYRNDAGTFTDIVAGLPGLYYGSVAWGDYDRDGDLDLALAGTADVRVARVYRNDGGFFTDIGAGLSGTSAGSIAWGDYDGDGDLDLVLTGYTGTDYVARVYKNGGGSFSMIAAGLAGVQYSAVDWGDFDDDGDPDLLITGTTGTERISRVYRNNGDETFTDIAAGLTGVSASSAAWGDFDNDGDLDALIAGGTGAEQLSTVYRNDGGGAFTDAGAGLPGVRNGAVAWGDYDNDNDLDILLTGYTGSERLGRVYDSDGAPANTPPAAPTGLARADAGDGSVTLSWNPSSDSQTPAAGLLYNLRVGTTPGGDETCPAMADGATGYRRVVRRGNAQQQTSWALTLPPGRYYWSVQAVDGAFSGSPFAAERSLTVVGFARILAWPPAVHVSAAAWGDYDDDGDLDLLLMRSDYVVSLYRNDGDWDFTAVAAGLPAVASGSVAWGDYDNDGDLDILVTGTTLDDDLVTRVYRNDPSGFTDIGAAMPGVAHGCGVWGDYDNDGDLDVLLTGATESPYSGPYTAIFRNSYGMFLDIGAGLPDLMGSSAAWGDCDNDGDLDVLLEGNTGSDLVSGVYRNDGAGTFTDASAGLPGAVEGTVAWGDYDGDGDLDILITGTTGPPDGKLTRVYRNDAGTFTDIAAAPSGLMYSKAAWGDYDNDGDLDFALTGESCGPGGACPVTVLCRNDGDGGFDVVDPPLPDGWDAAVAWGDFDNDGDLDLVLGAAGGGIYRNDGPPANTPPSAPGGLALTLSADHRLTMSWSPSTDSETPAAGLSYNIRIGTAPGGSQICAAMADGSDGYRRVAQLGNAQQGTSWTVQLPAVPEYYYCSVQAVDGAFAGSPFAFERSTAGVDDGVLPLEISLSVPGPNPAMGAVSFRIALPAAGRAELAIYDVTGRRVATVLDGALGAGCHDASWGAPGGEGPGAAGIYFARLKVGDRILTRRVVLLR